MPLVRMRVGESRYSWANPSVEILQELWDTVFPQCHYIIADGRDPIYKIVS